MKKANKENTLSTEVRYFPKYNRVREMGRVSSDRSVPLRASPAICVPARMETEIGMMSWKGEIRRVKRENQSVEVAGILVRVLKLHLSARLVE
jgi:hypothetical protein